jgi:hypothetical protein
MHTVTKLMAIALLLLPCAAAADKGGKGHGHGHGKDEDAPARGGPHGDATIVFGAREREAARGWFAETYGRGNCPPGLAKKHNGCLPPGQAKKRYAVGQPLAHGVVYGPVPPELAARIGPPPSGYVYVSLDGDLLKLATGTLLVVDAINGLMN